MYLKRYPFAHFPFRIQHSHSESLRTFCTHCFNNFTFMLNRKSCVAFCNICGQPTETHKKRKIQEEEKTFTYILYYSSLLIQNKYEIKNPKQIFKSFIRVLMAFERRCEMFQHFEHLNEQKMSLNLRRILDVDYHTRHTHTSPVLSYKFSFLARKIDASVKFGFGRNA